MAGTGERTKGNDITLLPGESQTLTVTYQSADLQGATPVISVSGWNVPKIDVAAPAPWPAHQTGSTKGKRT